MLQMLPYNDRPADERLAASMLLQLWKQGETQARIFQQEVESDLRVAYTGPAPSPPTKYRFEKNGRSHGYDSYQDHQVNLTSWTNSDNKEEYDSDETLSQCSGRRCTAEGYPRYVCHSDDPDCPDCNHHKQVEMGIGSSIAAEQEGQEGEGEQIVQQTIATTKTQAIYNSSSANLRDRNRNGSFEGLINVDQSFDGIDGSKDSGREHMKPKKRIQKSLLSRVAKEPNPSTPSPASRHQPSRGFKSRFRTPTTNGQQNKEQSFSAPVLGINMDCSGMHDIPLPSIEHFPAPETHAHPSSRQAKDKTGTKIPRVARKSLKGQVRNATPFLSQELGSFTGAGNIEHSRSDGLQNSVNSSKERMVLQTLTSEPVGDLPDSNGSAPFSIMKFLQRPTPKPKIKITIGNRKPTSPPRLPSSLPADTKRFDKEIQAQVRKIYAKDRNLPELEDSDNNVPDENMPYQTRRRIMNTPEDDYPMPVLDDMRIPPANNSYFGKISEKSTTQTPTEYWEERKEVLWKLELARLQEREAELMYRHEGQQSPGKHRDREGVTRAPIGKRQRLSDEKKYWEQ